MASRLSNLDRICRLHMIVFGSLQSTCMVLVIVALFIAGHYLGGNGKFWLWQIASAAAGVKSWVILYKLRILPKL